MVKVGEHAPDFSLLDQTGQTHNLAKYRGKWLLLYFYPKDDTPGCTKEACEFQNKLEELTNQGISVLGVSADSVQSHKKFAVKYNLHFPLLANPAKTTIKLYGARGLIMTRRRSFLIDRSGVIKKIYKKVRPAKHAGEILVDVQQLDGK
jgi:thioredoxin-dependent peroxiredoxin